MMINKLVMVVDDDTDLLTLIEVVLKRHGLAVLKVPNAELALHLVKSLKPNLFIVDVMLPGMDGFELCNILRETPHTADTPVIILSAHDSAQWRQSAREVGADEYVAKATFPNGLVQTIHGLIGNGTRASHRGSPGYCS